MNSSLQAQTVFAVAHASDVSAARRCGSRMADEAGFGETRAGQLAIVVTEAATNIVKHAREGLIVLSHIVADGVRGIDVLALDKGPGIADLGLVMHDGVSTAGTAGTGLGALRRLADVFDAYTAPGKGAAFFMRLWHGDAPRLSHDFAALCQPLAGETECGDAWAIDCAGAGLALVAADGLGHGPLAAAAGRAAVETLAAHPLAAPGPMLEHAHRALRPTRGAAVACARIAGDGHFHFAGVGNIAACVLVDGVRKQLVSHNGIVGHNIRKVQEFAVPCPPGALCILHSDGIQTSWDLAQYPGLDMRAPALVAGVLLRDFTRGRDDAMVMAVRAGGRA